MTKRLMTVSVQLDASEFHDDHVERVTITCPDGSKWTLCVDGEGYPELLMEHGADGRLGRAALSPKSSNSFRLLTANAVEDQMEDKPEGSAAKIRAEREVQEGD